MDKLPECSEKKGRNENVFKTCFSLTIHELSKYKEKYDKIHLFNSVTVLQDKLKAKVFLKNSAKRFSSSSFFEE
jgi:hypothetical protein